MFPIRLAIQSSRNPWWILVVWMLAVPGVRPIVHQHEPQNSSSCQSQLLEKHLSAFEHSADSNKEHLHWVFSLDGSVATPLPNGTWINGPSVSIPVDANDESTHQSVHPYSPLWEFALSELRCHQSSLNLFTATAKAKSADLLCTLESRERISDACSALTLFCIARQ